MEANLLMQDRVIFEYLPEVGWRAEKPLLHSFASDAEPEQVHS